MDIEGLFLATGPPCGDNTKIYVCVMRTPFTNCNKDMLDKLRDQIPNKYNCLGLVTSRVVAKVGDEEVYYISPLSYDQQRTYVRYMMLSGYAKRKAEIYSRREKKVLPEFVNYFAMICGWEEPKQHPPTRMCDVD